MIPEIGHLALVLGLIMALAQSLWPLYGVVAQRPALLQLAAPAALGQFLMVGLAFVALGWSFYANDFSVAYVAANSNTNLPWFYRITAIWGAHEGSMLLWVTVLSVWSLVVALASRSLPREVAGGVLAVMGLISVAFLVYILATASPFTRQFPAPAQGRDLNPLLQDPGMILHPPILYMGYVGFSVAFAFAITALITGRVDSAWTRWTRPWTLAAWTFLTIGVTLGSAWSYHVLGWGGWWFWDPVENASFMPWLVGTALLHSLAVTEKRGIFKSWTVLLAIVAFSLSLLGTFLVRSGVLISVHAFATDPSRGVYLLGFLGLAVLGSLSLFAARAHLLTSDQPPVEILSREALLLLNNLFLTVAAAAVLIGTLYPIFSQALGLGRVSVGPPYFDTVFVPLTAPLIVLVGLGGAMAWKRTRPAVLKSRLWLPLFATVAIGVILPAATVGLYVPAAIAGCVLGLWAIATAVEEIVRRCGGRRFKLPRQVVGMSVAHLGVGVFVIGVSLVSGFGGERDLRMTPGQSVSFAGYEFVFRDTHQERGPNYRAEVADFEIRDNGRTVAQTQPARRHYTSRNNTAARPGIDAGLFGDLYISLGKQVGDNAWSVRLYNRPFVRWIWAGGFLAALGGLIALSDKRYRRRRRKHANQAPKPRLAAARSDWSSDVTP